MSSDYTDQKIRELQELLDDTYGPAEIVADVREPRRCPVLDDWAKSEKEESVYRMILLQVFRVLLLLGLCLAAAWIIATFGNAPAGK